MKIARYVAPSEQAKLDREKAPTGGAMVAAAVPEPKAAPRKEPARRKRSKKN